ncbi:hypothetical protein ACFWUZ_20060 [Streptomyces sp. NPDC058646]|uniref:hypothetical protein n=1 Tax=Streptomyces sp. NPDC058646 TaxID=3346574 RepID=UPI003661AA99
MRASDEAAPAGQDHWGAELITEPELDGEWGASPSAGTAQELAPREQVAGRSRPWLWALGGAVAASAVWAGGLHAVGDRQAGPALSYRASKNLCEDFRTQALDRITGDLRKSRPVNHEEGHPAVDAAVCVMADGGDSPEYLVRAHVALHKKTDPAAEFDVPPVLAVASLGPARTEAVPGLGERAVMSVSVTGQMIALKVLDGGAVFTVQVEHSKSGPTGYPVAMDVPAVQAALITDTGDLIAALKE